MVLATDPYVWGTGRRKTSVARVRLKAGSGRFLVNDRPVDEFFTTPDTQKTVRQPLTVTESLGSYDVWVNVVGGGITGQSGAVSLGLARALKIDNPNLEPLLREHGLLTRDSRMIERKKYGLRKARRATQFSKR
ncbi:MAG: 30S ribosomal protein S9 [Planctomycetes bacterium]|nr:30S ribosomal protein S9 [Planctomycetota bacterium]